MMYYTLNDDIIDSLFNCEDNIKSLPIDFLELLRVRLDSLVSVQHPKNTVLCIAGERSCQGA